MAGEKDWKPSDPLEDKDEEAEAVLRAKRAARVKHLTDELLKKDEPEKKKSKWDI